MKILHTADLHLKIVGDERWQALEVIIQICAKENVDILTICGDLFDCTADAENLRDGIRNLFSSGSFQTIIIPGNHDLDSYKEGFYFGEGVKILNDPDWCSNVIDIDNVRLIGLPFENLNIRDFYRRIQKLPSVIKPKLTNIILYHGELLDSFYSRVDFGPGEENRYMPARLSYFKELEVDYVLAGHFHTNFDIRDLGNDKYFVYSGSPVSITKKELGQRAVNIFQAGSPPKEYPLDTFHYQNVEIKLNPFEDKMPIDKVKEQLATVHHSAEVLLTIGGYIKQAEDELVSNVNTLTKGSNIKVDYQFKDISRVLDHGLFSKIEETLSQAEIDETRKEQIINLAIRGMIEVGL